MSYTLTITNITQAQAVYLVEELGGGKVAFSSRGGKPINSELPASVMVAYPADKSVATVQRTK